MPEPNRAPPEPRYGHLSLDELHRRGVAGVEFYCLSCRRQSSRTVAELIRRTGPGVTLLMLARRARCGGCGRHGCHVQESPPPAPGTPHYRDWLRAEMMRAQAFLSEARAQL